MEIEAKIENLIFSPVYQRNNKKKGLKNLRCFPSCADEHREKGFCGRSITVSTNINPSYKDNNHEYVFVAYGEFVMQGESLRVEEKGCVVDVEEFDKLSRSKQDPCLPLIKGEPSVSNNNNLLSFEFNRNCHGWHYGWGSNKHSCDRHHNFVVYILSHHRPCHNDDNSTILEVLKEEHVSEQKKLFQLRAVVKSPSFIVFGRRRKRFRVIPTAPTAFPNVSTLKQNNHDDDLQEEEEEQEEEKEDSMNDDDRKRLKISCRLLDPSMTHLAYVLCELSKPRLWAKPPELEVFSSSSNSSSASSSTPTSPSSLQL